jgi:PAS domain S-box-containing protein
MTNVFDITSGMDLESVRLAEEIANQNEFSTVLINASPDGIAAYDLESRYTLWSPSMEKLTGLKKEEVLGRCAFDLFPFLKEAGIDKMYEKSFRGEVTRSSIVHYTVPSTGVQGFTEQQNFPLYNEQGKITGGFAIIRDVTRIKKNFDEILRINMQLRSRVNELENSLGDAKRSS